MVRKGVTTPVAVALVILIVTPVALLGYRMYDPSVQNVTDGLTNGGGSDDNTSRAAVDEQVTKEKTRSDFTPLLDWEPANPKATQKVDFRVVNDPPFEKVKWGFGDNDTAIGEEVSHSYRSEGAYNVQLNITVNGSKYSETRTLNINEAGEKPISDVGYSVDDFRAESEIGFSAYDSIDPEGKISEYRWDIDGTEKKGIDVSHTFNSPGNKTIRLTVINDRGLNDTRTTQIQVKPANQLPIPRLDIKPGEAKIGENVTFDASDSEDLDGEIKSYAWGIDDSFYQEGSEVNWNVFNSEGTYEIGLRIKDDENQTSKLTKKINVSVNQPPKVVINYEPGTPYVDEEVVFTANASDKDGDIAGYFWDFNEDGEYEEQGREKIRYYLTSGEKEVSLKVSDDQWDNATKSIRLNIQPPRELPKALFKYGPYGPAKGEEVAFNAEESKAESSISSYMWDWNSDGEYDDSGSTVTGSFTKAGTKEVTLKIETEDGNTDTVTEKLTAVNNVCGKMRIKGPPEKKADILLLGRNYESEEVMKDQFEYFMDFDGDNGGLFGVYPMNISRSNFNVWKLNAGVGNIGDYGEGLRSDSKEYFDQCQVADYDILVSKDNFGRGSYELSNTMYYGGADQDSGNNPRIFLQLWGLGFGNLKAEFATDSGADTPGRPNCAQTKSQAEDWWGEIAEENPKVGYEQGCGYSDDNWEPHPGATIMGRRGRWHYGPVNDRALLEKIDNYS